MKIYKEKPGVISKKAVWCCMHNGYLYVANTIEGLINVLNTEWEYSKYLLM